MSNYRFSTKQPGNFDVNFGPMGKALVQFNKDGTKVRIQMEHYQDNALRQDAWVVLRPDCPEVMRPGTWLVGMNKDCNKVTTVRPYEGIFELKFAGLRHKEGEAPVPDLKEGYDKKSGKKWQYYSFNPIFEVTAGEAQGMKTGYRYGLHYNFDSMADEQGRLIVVYSVVNLTKSPPTQLLDEFLERIGVFEKGPMPFKPNPPSILSYVEKRGLEANKRFHGVIKDGFVTTLSA